VLVGAPHDPISTRNEGAAGRDVARGPIPWDESHLNGFSGAHRAWLETAELSREWTVEAQMETAGSPWHRYHELVVLRERHPTLLDVPMRVIHRGDEVLVFERGRYTAIVNLSASLFELTPKGRFDLVYASTPEAAVAGPGRLAVAAETTALIRRAD